MNAHLNRVLFAAGAFFLVGHTTLFESPLRAQQTDTSQQETKPPTKEDLQAHFAKLQKAIEEQDEATAAALTREIFPDKASLQVALKDEEVIEKVLQFHAEFREGEDEALAGLFATGPGKRELRVHAATTEELIANEQDSVAWEEFPGGAIELAEKFFQPEVTFYEIEVLEPGEDSGMRYHLFYHDGKAWKMLGPIWRMERQRPDAPK